MMSPLSDKPVLVTGGTGYIASHIVYQLLEKGYHVRATVRNKSDPKSNFLTTFHENAPTHVELFEADSTHKECWGPAVNGCEFVIHTASPFSMKMAEDELVRIAVDGTKNVLEAVGQNKESVKKVVLTSSVASVMVGHTQQRYEEGPLTDTDFSVEQTTHGYELSKLKAELAAWELQKRYGFNMDAICPGLVLGPVFAKHHLSCQSSEYIVTLLKNTLFLGVDVCMPLTDVRDVARLHILAMEKDQSTGNRYISASDKHTRSSVMYIARTLHTALNGKSKWNPPSHQVPNSIAWAMSFVHPDLKSARDWIGSKASVSNQKAKDDFKFEFRDLDEGIIGHAISLFKYCELDSKGYPQDEIDNYKAY